MEGLESHPRTPTGGGWLLGPDMRTSPPQEACPADARLQMARHHGAGESGSLCRLNGALHLHRAVTNGDHDDITKHEGPRVLEGGAGGGGDSTAKSLYRAPPQWSALLSVAP